MRYKYSLHTNLVLQFLNFVVSLTRATNQCSNMQEFDPTINDCVCKPGYTGITCTEFNFTALPENPATYSQGLISATDTTWGASFYFKTKNYEIMLAETIPNQCGVQYWGVDSTCAFWGRKLNTNDTWQVISYLGNFFKNNPLKVPYCHEARATIEMKEVNGIKSYAFAAYTTPKFTRATRIYAPANFNPRPNCNSCNGITPFAVKTENRVIFIAYKNLAATNISGLQDEIENLVFTRQYVTNINNSTRSGHVNTALTWLNLPSLIDQVDDYAVNPAPLIDKNTNLGGLYTAANGTKYRILMYRYNQKHGRTEEHLGLLYSFGDRFPWETNTVIYTGPKIVNSHRQEDANLVSDGKIITATIHDLDLCGKPLAKSCGAILTFNLTDPQNDLLKSSKGWTPAQQAYTAAIPNLKQALFARQRPYEYYCSDKNGERYPCILWTGTAWSSSKTSRKCIPFKYGASRAFPVYII